MRDYVFIGGGASGAMVLIYAAQKARKQNVPLAGTTFHLFDPNGFGCGGIAYGQTKPGYVLNSVHGEMSPWLQDAFHNACNGHDAYTFEKRGPGGYRDFLQAQLQDALSILRNSGAIITEHKTAAFPCMERSGLYMILNEAGHTVLSDVPMGDIVLAPGYGPNVNFPELWQYTGNGYTHSLYTEDWDTQIQQRQDPKTIIVAGSGPALYDFVNGYTGNPEDVNLIVVSAAGEGLDVRDVSVESGETRVMPSCMSAVPDDASVEALREAILSDFGNAIQNGTTRRRAALDIIRNFSQIMPRLREDITQAFLRSAFCNVLRHAATPIPQESADRLREFNPIFIQGHLDSAAVERKKNGRFDIVMNGKVLARVNWIINATGHGRHNAPVLEHLKRQGLADIDPKTGVLATDGSGFRLSGSGLMCVGPAVHSGTDGVESFSGPAKKIAETVIENIRHADIIERQAQYLLMGRSTFSFVLHPASIRP